MRIHVTIERLVLKGLQVPHHQREALREAVAAELGRLLQEQGLAGGWMEGGSVHRLQAGSLPWTAEAGPQPLGQQIARTVAPSLGGERINGGNGQGTHR